MKSLLIVSARGSTGRATLTCLLARYLQSVCHRRVLVLDLAEPAHCGHVLGACQDDAVVIDSRTADLREAAGVAADGCVHVLSTDAIGGFLSHDDPARTCYYANLRHLLSVVVPWFDVCLIDCPALPDLRAVCAEALVDAVLSPVTVSPECIDCAAEVINGAYGIRNVRARLNPPLRFVGLLPVLTARTSLEEAPARVMATTLRAWLIPHPVFRRGYVYLPHLNAIGHLQGRIVPGGQPAGHDTGETREESRATVACLDAITHRLEAIRCDGVPAVLDAEVCDA